MNTRQNSAGLKGEEKKFDKENENKINAFIVYTKNLETKNWCLNSGATEHVMEENCFVQVGEQLEVEGLQWKEANRDHSFRCIVYTRSKIQFIFCGMRFR